MTNDPIEIATSGLTLEETVEVVRGSERRELIEREAAVRAVCDHCENGVTLEYNEAGHIWTHVWDTDRWRICDATNLHSLPPVQPLGEQVRAEPSELRHAAEVAYKWIARVSNQYYLGGDDPHEAMSLLNAALKTQPLVSSPAEQMKAACIQKVREILADWHKQAAEQYSNLAADKRDAAAYIIQQLQQVEVK
jgi:hypothetical protein